MLMFESWQNRERRGERGIKKTGGSSRQTGEGWQIKRGRCEQGKKKRGRVFVTDGRTVGWDEEQERKGGKIPDLLQCDPVIWGVGVATEAVRHSDAGVWVTEAAGAWAWGTKHQHTYMIVNTRVEGEAQKCAVYLLFFISWAVSSQPMSFCMWGCTVRNGCLSSDSSHIASINGK